MTTNHNSKIFCLACGGQDMAFWAHAKDIEYYTTDEVFDYLRCNACGALSISPVPVDRMSLIYPKSYYSFSGRSETFVESVKQALDRRLFRKMFDLIDPSASKEIFSALDVGGGSGWLLKQARMVEPRLKDTVVVDIDTKAEDSARKAGHTYFLGRIEDYQAFKKFDLILMLNLIEHVKDPVGMIRKAGSMLAPGGRILIKTPNYDSLDAKLFRKHSWGGYHCPRHWVIFSPDSFRIAAVSANVEIESLTLTQGAPFWTWSVLNMLKNFGLVKINAERPADQHPLSRYLMACFAAFDFLRAPLMKTSQMFIVLKNEDI